MPVQTAIQVRRGTASSWTSTNPTLAAGEIGFETDTSKFKIGTGSTAWNSLNYFVQDPVTTKGDLYTFSTTDARLAVGNNGETLVADSSASTGLRWQGNFAAGKNKIINGDFNIWQRGTSFSNPANNSYLADRWTMYNGGAPTTFSYSRQAFTTGTAPVAGYEGTYFMRSTITTVGSNTAFLIFQPIEDVRTLAGQTVTVSFWAKTDSNRTITVALNQNFGSGGSSEVGTSMGSASSTTSWQRFSFTATLPSISGKTIGTNSSLNLVFTAPSVSGMTFDLWGVQVEAGSVATAFQTATGTLAGEFLACARYCFVAGGNSNYERFGVALPYSNTDGFIVSSLPAIMRTTPSFAVSAVGDWGVELPGVAALNLTAISIGNSSPSTVNLSYTTASNANFSSGKSAIFRASNTTNARLTFSAEL